jgi:DNA-damage-inducible protein J
MEVIKMAKTDTLHIRVEPDVKIKAEETLNDLGLSITEAVNVFLNQVILHDGIPFKIEKPKYNKETIQAMEDVKSGKNLSKTFDSVDEMFEELDK